MNAAICRRLTVVSMAFVLFGAAAGCGGENSETSCSLNSCTVTFDRGVDASASVLGVKAELVEVRGNSAVLSIGGQRVTVPVGEQEQSDGFNVAVQSITKDNVVVKISHSGG